MHSAIKLTDAGDCPSARAAHALRSSRSSHAASHVQGQAFGACRALAPALSPRASAIGVAEDGFAERAGAFSGGALALMLCFTLTGRIGRILCCAEELQLAVASACLYGQHSKATWVACVARDQLLRSSMTRHLRSGSIVRIEGEIEPRRREIKGTAFYDVVFVAKRFEVLETEPFPLSDAEARS